MEQNWVTKLQTELINVKKLVIVGVGNPLKGDDGVGPYCAGLLSQELKDNPNIKVINAGEVIENFTGDIRKFKPSHVIIIDAASDGSKPGTVFLVDPDKIGNEDVSTHRMPLSMAVHFIEQTMGAKVVLIGIEPESLELNKELSELMKQTANRLADNIINLDLLKNLCI